VADRLTNLLTETIRALDWHEKKPEDVWWVGSGDGKLAVSWKAFTEMANIEYDSGYGSQKIASDLVVVGDSWWLSRHEYDGSESWSYHTIPVLLESAKGFTRVEEDHKHWVTLEEMDQDTNTKVVLTAEAYNARTVTGDKPNLDKIVSVEVKGRKFRIE